MTLPIIYEDITSEDSTVDIAMTEQEKKIQYQSYVRKTWFFEDLKDEPDLYEDYR